MCADSVRGSSRFQFRISTLLWLFLVVGAFLVGRYLQPPVPDPQSPAVSDVWDPSRSIGIGIAGAVDLDGDGINDLARLKSMIETNGGTVVAFQESDGSVQGELDSATRYLVVADEPVNDALLKEARKHAVETINLDRLLKWMGLPQDNVSSTSTGFRSRKPVD